MDKAVVDNITSCFYEIWKPVPNYETRYIASSHGRIRSLKRHMKILVGGPHKGGYCIFHLYKEGARKVTTRHAVIALTFLGECPDGMQVCHIDGNPSNCKLDNLLYVTPKENSSHKRIHGTLRFGETSPVAKLTEKGVVDILNNHHDGNRVLAIKYGVTHSNISAIRLRKSWKHINAV